MKVASSAINCTLKISSRILCSLFCSVMIVCLALGNAFAQTPRSLGASVNRSRVSSDSKISVKQRTDNVTKKKKQKTSQREMRESSGRRVSQAEIRRIVGEKQLSGALVKEIKFAERVLSKLPKKSPQRPRILQRLIESYHNRAQLVFYAESRQYDKDWTRWDRGGRKGPEPTMSTSKSEAWTSRVVQSAQQFITEYPRDPKVDEAYFQIAYALDTLGKRREAASYYSQLVARFPNSVRVPDAHFAVGEYYFDRTDFRKALTAFKEAAKYSRSSIYPWAYFKLGWCYYNLQDYRNSLGAFQNTVRISRSARNLTKEGRERLKEEALRDTVNVYAALRDINGAERYFSSVGGQKYFGELLTMLAASLREAGEYTQSISVLKRFISRNPTDMSAADIQIQIVDTANLLADKRLLWSELQVLLKNYNPESLWGRKNKDKTEYKELQNRVQEVAINYPKTMHAAGQKQNNKYLLQQAALGYQLYLRAFPNHPDADEVKFLLGEIQYQLSDFNGARVTFWELANKGKKGAYFVKSSQYLLSSAYLPIEKGMQVMRKAAARLGQPKRPINPAVQEYLKVCAKVKVWFPKSASAKDCLLDETEIYLKHNYYAKAEEGLWEIARRYSKGKEGKDAAELLLWLASKDSKKLVSTSEKLAQIESYQKGEIGKRLATIDETNKFEQTLELEKSGEYSKAAAAFAKLAQENPRGNETDKAWYNAGVNYRKAGEANLAVSAFKRVYTDHPKAAQAPDALLAIIEISESQLRLDEAVSHSLLFVERYGQDKRAQVVLEETCFLNEALNQVSSAEKACGTIIRQGGAKAADAAQALARVYERNGRYGELVTVTDTYLMKLPVSPEQKLIFLGKAAAAEKRLGRRGRANQRENQIMSIFSANRSRISGEALAYVGEIAFERASPILAKYRAAKLQAQRQDGADLQASITTKQGLLTNLERSFRSVIETGDAEWGVAAMFTIGAAYEVFANDLQNPPMPPGLPPEAQKQTIEGLRALGQGPAQKALAYYTQGAETVAKFGVYTDFSKRNIEALSRIQPEKYRVVEEWIPSSIFVGTKWAKVRPAARVFRILETQ